MIISDLDSGALQLADHAFAETEGPHAAKVQAAIWAYLWAQRSMREQFGTQVYPSLNELREALRRARTS